MKNILPLSAEDFALFQELLTETSGLFFEASRNQTLHLALWQRLQHRGYDSYREYYNLLKFHPEGRLEIRELLDLITIGETYFFRNKAQFDVLMRFVLPEIMQKKADSCNKSIRVWSAGCSGGDETYSIAMAMMEVVPSYQDWRISVLGTDINRNGLACAKEAIYGEKHIAHLPKEYLGKYFKAGGSTYRLSAKVQELTQFEYHNLAKDPFIQERMQDLDILFCRNVIIYFDGQTTQRVIENFHNCLAQDGYLFLGHSETLWQITDKFERVEFPQTFIYKKRSSPAREDVMKPFIAVPELAIGDLTFSAAPIPVPYRHGSGPAFEAKGMSRTPGSTPGGSSPSGWGALRLAEIKDETPLPSPKHMIEQGNNHIRTYLTKATLLANEAKYKEATDILGKIIEADNLSVEAYYLLGVLSYKSSNLNEAETQFRKVIYVDPESVIAYFNLANMYLYQRKFREAAREFKNAIRLLEKRPRDEQVRFCEDFTVEFLLRACRNSLVEISKRGE